MATVFPDPAELAVIETELLETAHYAKRQPRIIGTPACPTRWDEAHEYLDGLLEDWQHAHG